MTRVFKKIRYQLLLSYLIILALILGLLVSGIRLIFFYNLRQQLIEKLTALGEGATANAEWENNHLTFDNNFDFQELLKNYQSLEWFDSQGNSILKQGKFIMNLPFSPNHSVEFQDGNPNIQGIIVPIIDHQSKKVIGYLRVSQSLEELQTTLTQLDWGLGISIILALSLSGIGGIILTNQAIKPIEESFQRLKQFTADASHELRNPLMVIDTNVAVSLKYSEGMRTCDQESFNIISSAVAQMINLTEDLLILARADQLNSLKKERVNLTQILDNLLNLFTSEIDRKKLSINIEIPELLFICGDELKLTRLLRNLIENSIFYTPSGGSIMIQVIPKKLLIEIQIKDTGIGIKSEDFEQIFERFWRGDTSRAYWSGGSGLGLSIVQAIVNQHGGTITVTSQVGIGSCFKVCLPIK